MGAPGAEDGCQRHLALGALLQARASSSRLHPIQLADVAPCRKLRRSAGRKSRGRRRPTWPVRSIGVAQVVDVPQQVGPAPLLGAVIMVVGSVEIADQYSGESIAGAAPSRVPHVAVRSTWAGRRSGCHCRLGPLRRRWMASGQSRRCHHWRRITFPQRGDQAER